MESASYRVPVNDDEILKEARKRYQRAAAAGERNKQRYKEAIRFAAGEQWDAQLASMRKAQGRPCLTMDRLGTHINQVVNDQRQSKPAIKVHPVDDKADVKTAEIYNGLIRNIEHRSNAPMVYETASYTQVAGGQGAWRILTEYSDEEAFEQDIVLRRVLDPTSITWDPDAKEMDGSDAMFCFIEETYSMDAFKDRYPGAQVDNWPGRQDELGWWDGETVRCAEYYRVAMKPSRLFLMRDGSVMDEQAFAKSGALPTDVVDQRPAKKREVQWFKLGGHSVIDSRIWPGKWIPVVRIVGNELSVDGEIRYTGLTHRAMDAQRMYNYQTSVMVEMLSLQKTAPWVAATGQIKDKKLWAQANQNNNAVLEYDPVNVDGILAPAPSRQTAPQVPTGNVAAMQNAAQDLQWVTGQHSASFGAPSNESSGKAINARAREGDTATYHYLDNESRGILHTGRILVDLIPKIYDSTQILRVLGEDDTATIVEQDPQMNRARVDIRDEQGQLIKRIYNLGVGRYDVAVSVGPSFGTLRQEATEAMTQLLQGNPQLWTAIGDLYVRGQDWPYSQQIADRLAKMVPPELKGEDDGGDQAESKLAELQGVAKQLEMALQEREAMLNQAGHALQQMESELQTLKAQEAERRAQSMDKTQAEQIRAQTEIYKSDNEVRIAEIEASKTMLEAQQGQASQEMDGIRQLIEAIAQRLEAPEEKDDEQEMQAIQQLAQNQSVLSEQLAAVLEAIKNKPPIQIEVVRGADGRAVKFVGK